MKYSVALVLTVTLAGLPTGGAHGQTVPTDSVLRSYYDALLALRDTASALQGTVQTLGRDFRSAGDETLTLRAETLRRRCAAARAFAAGIAPVFARTRAPARLRDAVAELRAETGRFRQGLERECISGLGSDGTPMPVDSLRTWGRYRASRIQQLITVYQRAALVFARHASIRLPPRSPR